MKLKIQIVLDDTTELKNTLEQIENIYSQSIEELNVEIVINSNRPYGLNNL
ncbi:hypothetical protein JGU43_13495 [Staphylococcus aureus]|uniref:hypothetical protein n=1 Tax=Staphylococcus aureus TaxID=1280 RepID=UPI0018E92A18|nr:hypothetical protein [Staphylococcus aureus]MBJ6289359.1 hypothetical protein [Staphylococcus aureus]MBJ6291508.1 hypothetical protein [Staphylococcus aureus]MBJ6293936.1 hypothetical protein [Staphylococcus aureus]MBJ6296664.1 hypothetical protein [Staphylococcus aureus]MBJ6307581.1 hypothetical protein [Staphylococcus aureus]